MSKKRSKAKSENKVFRTMKEWEDWFFPEKNPNGRGPDDFRSSIEEELEAVIAARKRKEEIRYRPLV